jgi:hypothetical protein
MLKASPALSCCVQSLNERPRRPSRLSLPLSFPFWQRKLAGRAILTESRYATRREGLWRRRTRKAGAQLDAARGVSGDYAVCMGPGLSQKEAVA